MDFQRTIARPHAWQLTADGLVRFGPVPGFENVETPPPLPVACVEEANRQSRDPVAFFVESWLPMHGDASSIPVPEPINLPPGLSAESQQAIRDELRRYSPESDARAAELGVPALIRTRAKNAKLNPLRYFDEEVRPLFSDTTTDYPVAVYVDDDAKIERARNAWSDLRANLSFSIGIPVDVIQAAHRFGKDPIRYYDSGAWADKWPAHGGVEKTHWFPSAYLLALQAGMPDALPEEERRMPGAVEHEPDAMMDPRARFLAGKLTGAEIASRAPRARWLVADGDSVPAGS